MYSIAFALFTYLLVSTIAANDNINDDNKVKKLEEQMEHLLYINKLQQESLYKQLTDMTTLIVQQNDRITALESELEDNKQNSTVAFSAYMWTYQMILQSGEVLPFDRTFTNIGGHFNTESHEFVCPINGAYYFSVCLNNGELGSAFERFSEVTLYNRGFPVVQIFSYNAISSPGYIIDQACVSVVEYCEAGDAVWLACTSDGSHVSGTKLERPLSTFTGFLVYAGDF